MEEDKLVRQGRQLVGEKLKRGFLLIGKREGNSTPSPTWLFGLIQPDGTLIPDLNFSYNSDTTLSARKLGASVWEMLPQDTPSLARLSKIGPVFGHQKGDSISAKELSSNQELPQLGNSITLGGQAAAQHDLQVKNRVVAGQQPLSPASYRSSMEMRPYQPSISTSGFLVSNGKHGESSQGLKTSTELLKVLNRIWSLEEKHALDMSLVKMLRRELDQSQARIQELQQEKDTDQAEITNLTKQLSEYKAAKKKEKGRLDDAVKEAENKVEEQNRLRGIPERRDHNLDMELLDSKSLPSHLLRELERERKARRLLEDLCDEFAKGITDYEQEVRSVKRLYCKDQIGMAGVDRLILHMSEAWLDQRSQRKLSDNHDISEKQSDLEKMCFEIEGFLQAKQSGNFGNDECASAKKPCESKTLKQSSESFHWNHEHASAPWKTHNEDDSVKVTTKSRTGKKKVQSRMNSDPSTSQLQLELEHGNEMKHEGMSEDAELTRPRINASHRRTNSRMGEATQRSAGEGSSKITNSTSVDLQDTTLETVTKHRKNMEGSFDPSSFTGVRSPVRKWTLKASITDPEISGAPSKWAGSVRSRSLKAKLMEEGRQSPPGTSRGVSLKIN